MTFFKNPFAEKTTDVGDAVAFAENLIRAGVEVATGKACFFTKKKLTNKLIFADPQGTATALMLIKGFEATARLYGDEEVSEVNVCVDEFNIHNSGRSGWYFEKHSGVWIKIDGTLYNLNISSSTVRPNIRTSLMSESSPYITEEWVGTHAGDRHFEKR